MFSLTSLKCFAAAAEELNFTRAAKRLFISQQALSSHTLQAGGILRGQAV